VTYGTASLQPAILSHLGESVRTLQELADQAVEIEKAARVMIACLRDGGKIVTFGNGGSAADAQHFAAELSGRFEKDRPGLGAVALTTNVSTLTAIANDYDYAHVFVRQVQGFVKKGDVAVGISTSGNSRNVLEALAEARKLGAATVAWTGRDGGKMKAVVDICLRVPSDRTPRVQEGHVLILHTLCSLVEDALYPSLNKVK
jgi:D-sedoheptulose 7-phosphate isomerase